MMTDSTNPLVSTLPFEYLAGDPALDLVNTVDWTSRGLEQERLTDFDRLTRWAEGAGIISSRAGGILRARANAKPREAEATHRASLQAREVLQRLFSTIAGGRPPGEALDDFNQLLGRALEHMRVVPASGGKGRNHRLKLGWGDMESRLESVIWPVLW